MQIKYLLTLCFCFSTMLMTLHAQGIEGVIKDGKGDRIGFATIYLQGSITKGSSANIEGEYSLALPEGKNIVEFRMVGYKTKVDTIIISGKKRKTHSVVLEEMVAILQNLDVIYGEDPAIPIMKKAIANREKNGKIPSELEYNCFSKMLMRFSDISGYNKFLPKKDSALNLADTIKQDLKNQDQILYMGENQTIVSRKEPNLYKETMIASRQSGDSSKFFSLFGGLQQPNFYSDLISPILSVSKNKFVSPLASFALDHYRFFLIDSIIEPDGSKTHLIKMIPKNKADNAFFGFIYIADSSWKMRNIDVKIGHENKFPFFDSLRIRQSFLPLNEDDWVIDVNQIEGYVRIPILGISICVDLSISVYNQNFNLSPSFPKNFFSNEILRIEKNASTNDSSFWMKSPITQTDFEKTHYHIADSIFRETTSVKALTEADKERNKLSWHHLWKPYSYRFSPGNWRLDITTPLHWFLLDYNSRQGLIVHPSISFTKRFTEISDLHLKLLFQHGLKSKRNSGYTAGEWNIDKSLKKKLSWNLGVTSFVQFHPENIDPEINSVYAFFKKDYLEIYEKTWGDLKFETEVLNGLDFVGSVSLEQRSAAFPDFPFDSNSFIPEASRNFETHRAFILDAMFFYTPGSKYGSMPYKVRFKSIYPTFGIGYRKAFPNILGSSTSYDLLKGSIRYIVPMGRFGFGKLFVEGGTFLKKPTHFIDYKHYAANQIYVGLFELNHFRALPYYKYSTVEDFVELHYQHNSNRWLFSKLPLLKKTNLCEEFEIHALANRSQHPYIEFSFGVSRIFQYLSIHYTIGIQNQSRPNHNIMMGFKMSF